MFYKPHESISTENEVRGWYILIIFDYRWNSFRNVLNWILEFDVNFLPKFLFEESKLCFDVTMCSVMLMSSSASRNCSSMYLGAMSVRDCLAEGVIRFWTTMIARVMFSSCILWQYVFMVFIPTFGSSGKNTNIWSGDKEKNSKSKIDHLLLQNDINAGKLKW